MAVAALALEPLIAKYGDPEKAAHELEAAAVEARSLTHQALHSASLTAKEQYEGVLPLVLVLYRVWQTFVGPQVEFGLATQIGLAQVLNRFGANIDTTQLSNILAKVQKSRTPFAQQTPQAGFNPNPPIDTTIRVAEAFW